MKTANDTVETHAPPFPVRSTNGVQLLKSPNIPFIVSTIVVIFLIFSSEYVIHNYCKLNVSVKADPSHLKPRVSKKKPGQSVNGSPLDSVTEANCS